MAHGILVPTDGSVLATRVLPYAALLAREFDAEAAVVQAVELDLTPSFSFTTGRWEHAGRAVERALADAQARLKAVRDELALQGVRAESLVQPGSPASVVLNEARLRQASLIVMATHGRTGVSRYALGSVAEQVLRQAQVPVVS